MPDVVRLRRWLAIAETVVPHAIPSTMPSSNHWPSRLAATAAVWSSRCSSVDRGRTGTTWARIPKLAASRWPSAAPDLLAGCRTVISTIPTSRACEISLDTVERETCSVRAMTSIVWFCR